MSDLLFYEKVVALNDQAHAGLRVKPLARYRFAARINSVPLLASEFAEAAREYPIVFVRGAGGALPAALLGLREGENLFVDGAGAWTARYIPAFVRRYPFAPGKDAQGQLLVCIDEAAPCFSKDEGEALFDGGKPTRQLQFALDFMREYQQGAQLTETVSRRIAELGLLRDADSVAQLKGGQQFRLQGLSVVDEARLRALERDAVLELFGSGVLGMIHAHLVSLGNLGALADKLERRTAGEKGAVRH